METTRRRPNNATRQAKIYRVYIEQVNQTYVEVEAKDQTEAREKGYAKWRRDEAHSSVTWIEKLPSPVSG